MHITAEHGLLAGSFLLLLSIIGGNTTSKWSVPTLIFFLLVGTTLPAVAKLLHLTVPGRAKRRTDSDLEFIDPTMSSREEVALPHHAVVNGRRIAEINFPKTVKILRVVRGKDYITPEGSTVLRADDRLLILAEYESAFSLAMHSLGMAH